MPRTNIDRHFEDERPEWTKRKHDLLGRYVVPAAMKISLADGFRRVHLVDGYAGPNEYGGKVSGSTVIMIQAALKAEAQGRKVRVHACEVDLGRFDGLRKNLGQHIESGLLRVYNRSHAEALSEIQQAIADAPAVVFLDPQTAAQMTLDRDIKPWSTRKRTDILGVFMASQACRISASALSAHAERAATEAVLGTRWPEATTEQTAVEIFFEQIRPLKKFAGLYLLRKVEPERSAYAIFGLSDSAHGYRLLSDAVAKDAQNLKVADEAKKVEDLFSEANRQQDAESLLQRLVEIVRPIVQAEPSLTGEKIATKILEDGIAIAELFGRYQGKDFTAAKNRIIGKPARKPEMPKQSSIEWTHWTWNPVTGCTKVSQGCKHCYAERMAKRLKAMGSPRYQDGFRVTLHQDLVDLPRQWRTPKLVFVNSMSDLFHEDVPLEFIQAVFKTMRECPQHTFQVLTKRSKRLAQVCSELDWPNNVWMGVSVEDAQAMGRVDHLRQVPAVIRFLSCEPLIGPLDGLDLSGIHWVIVGGESGYGSRPMEEDWVRDIRGACQAADVPFFFKQWGGVQKHRTGRELDDRTWDAFPRRC